MIVTIAMRVRVQSLKECKEIHATFVSLKSWNFRNTKQTTDFMDHHLFIQSPGSTKLNIGGGQEYMVQNQLCIKSVTIGSIATVPKN